MDYNAWIRKTCKASGKQHPLTRQNYERSIHAFVDADAKETRDRH